MKTSEKISDCVYKLGYGLVAFVGLEFASAGYFEVAAAVSVTGVALIKYAEKMNQPTDYTRHFLGKNIPITPTSTGFPDLNPAQLPPRSPIGAKEEPIRFTLTQG